MTVCGVDCQLSIGLQATRQVNIVKRPEEAHLAASAQVHIAEERLAELLHEVQPEAVCHYVQVQIPGTHADAAVYECPSVSLRIFGYCIDVYLTAGL